MYDYDGMESPHPPIQPSLQPASAEPSAPAVSDTEPSTETMPQPSRESLMARFELLEAALKTMSNVRHVPMLAQFNELDREYNLLFARSAATMQKLFDAEATIRTLTDLNTRYAEEFERYRAAGVQLSEPWWRQGKQS